jgi:hypothetical protein
MAQIEQKIIITYRWWNNEVEGIPPEHQAVLDEHANEHITEQMRDGVTSGELNCQLHNEESGPDKEITYDGWFEITTETTNVSFPPESQA